MAHDPGRELLILGLLRRKGMSPYALNRAVREHAPLYRPMRSGNVYSAVARMVRDGLLLGKQTAAQRGPRDEKTIYRLSAAGEHYFLSLLRDVIGDVQTPDPTIEIAYVLLGQLPRGDAIGLLALRLERIAEQERRLTRLTGDIEQRSGAGYLGLSHTAARLRGERRFLRDALELLENGKWNPEWVLDDGPIVDRRRFL